MDTYYTTIKISGDVWKKLNRERTTGAETFNDVLRRWAEDRERLKTLEKEIG